MNRSTNPASSPAPAREAPCRRCPPRARRLPQITRAAFGPEDPDDEDPAGDGNRNDIAPGWRIVCILALALLIWMAGVTIAAALAGRLS